MKKESIFQSLRVLILLSVIFLSYFFVFLQNISVESPFSSYVDANYEFEALTLTEVIRPDYLHPFRPVEFHYLVNADGMELIERSTGAFTYELENIQGDPGSFYDSEIDGMFLRGFVPYEYAAWPFFMLQYALVLLVMNELRKCKYLFSK